MKNLLFLHILIILLSSCMKEKPLKITNNGFTPIVGNDDWEISTLKAQSLDSSLVAKAYDYFYSSEQLPMSRSLIVIRNGKIVAEAYSKDKTDIDRIENIQSCTKSIVSLLVGIAEKKRLLTDLNTPLYQYIPEHFPDDPEKRKITLRHCLTMVSGLSYSGGDDSEELIHTKTNSLKWILDKPLISQPGTSFLYSDFSPQLINGVLTKVAGESVETFAVDNLFKPLGIHDYEWEKSKDGLNLGAFSLYLRPRDLGKIAQLCLQKGKWKNETIFEGWIEQATAKQSDSANYGYFFWINPGQGAYTMEGNGRQLVFVSPAKNLVIVHTASPYTSIPLWGDLNPVIDNIYNACK